MITKSKFCLAMGLMIGLSSVSFAKKKQQLSSPRDKASYSIGQKIGQGMKQQGVDINVDVLTLSIKDALAGNSKLTPEQIEESMVWLQKEMKEKMEKAAKDNEKKGKEFLEKNKKNKGVKVLASGLQYKVIKNGSGASPSKTDKVEVHYEGSLLDGTIFDSSYKRNKPATFGVGQVIKGWTEALQLMKPGAVWELYIPSELAYGSRGTAGIPGNSVLKFKVELKKVVKPKAKK